ncbi:MAG: pyridoxamine 5'-phosphate oxidase family protein [Acidimicrobiales bacterium]
MHVVSRARCLELLSGGAVGRVVFTQRALPTALPVNYALLGDDVVFRTATGSKLSMALARSVVAFQADDIDPVSRKGWSVLVQGWATLLTRPDEVARARALPLQSWAPGDRWHFIHIRSEIVSGHELAPVVRDVPARAEADADARQVLPGIRDRAAPGLRGRTPTSGRVMAADTGSRWRDESRD